MTDDTLKQFSGLAKRAMEAQERAAIKAERKKSTSWRHQQQYIITSS